MSSIAVLDRRGKLNKGPHVEGGARSLRGEFHVAPVRCGLADLVAAFRSRGLARKKRAVSPQSLGSTPMS